MPGVVLNDFLLKPTLRVLSLGGGVQSVALGLMAERGDLRKKPDMALFADTGDEPDYVYDQVNWFADQVSYPVYIIKREHSEGIWSDLKKDFGSYIDLPLYIKSKEGNSTMLSRRCTKVYKIKVIHSAIREHLGVQRMRKKSQIEMWIGISYDEINRVRPPEPTYIGNLYPLVMNKITREQCYQWVKDNYNYELKKSACVFCPYRDNLSWKQMKHHDPEAFAKAVAFEKFINANAHLLNLDADELFIHSSLVPLDQADFEPKRPEFQEVNPFDNECFGICGV